MTFLGNDFKTVFLEKHEEYKDINKDVQKKNDALLRIFGKHETKSLIYAGTYAGFDDVITLLIDNTDKEDSLLLNDSDEMAETATSSSLVDFLRSALGS